MSTDKGDAASEPKGAKALAWLEAFCVRTGGDAAAALADLRALIAERDNLKRHLSAFVGKLDEDGNVVSAMVAIQELQAERDGLRERVAALERERDEWRTLPDDAGDNLTARLRSIATWPGRPHDTMTAAADLIDSLRGVVVPRLRTERDEALGQVAALREYAGHKRTCEDTRLGKCTCGIASVLTSTAAAVAAYRQRLTEQILTELGRRSTVQDKPPSLT